MDKGKTDFPSKPHSLHVFVYVIRTYEFFYTYGGSIGADRGSSPKPPTTEWNGVKRSIKEEEEEVDVVIIELLWYVISFILVLVELKCTYGR